MPADSAHHLNCFTESPANYKLQTLIGRNWFLFNKKIDQIGPAHVLKIWTYSKTFNWFTKFLKLTILCKNYLVSEKGFEAAWMLLCKLSGRLRYPSYFVALNRLPVSLISFLHLTYFSYFTLLHFAVIKSKKARRGSAPTQ